MGTSAAPCPDLGHTSAVPSSVTCMGRMTGLGSDVLDLDTGPATVALIGSFRKHYSEICDALAAFQRAGVLVTTPLGAGVIQPGIPFVRFESDNEELSDEHVQTIALHRILRARAVYVVAPAGYIGLTTAFEIGRVLQAGRPLYFSEPPDDLPILVPSGHVCGAQEVAAHILGGSEVSPYKLGDEEHIRLERRLLTGDYSSE